MEAQITKPKILIVDDVQDNLTSLRRILAGFDVDIVETLGGEEALALTLDNEFALVLLDVQMPEMDGYETAMLMRGAEHTKHTPIIFLTANSREMIHELKGYESGAVDYITKPVNRSILLGKVGVFLELFTQKAELKQLNSELTEAKKAADYANEMKAVFLANMSHEIRTPMNGVVGMTELLLNTELNEKQKKYASTAYKCGQDLIELVNDILDYSKIEAGQLELAPDIFDLHEFINETEILMGVLANKNKVELVIENELGDLHNVLGDMHRLRQIMNNLVSNAIKFTHGGKVTIRLSKKELGGDKADIRFEVEDTGIGIPKEKQYLLFQKFAQIDASTTKRYGGTGLGLAICKSLIDLMGGEIGMESEEGKGSLFWFSIPMDKKDAMQFDNVLLEKDFNILFVGLNTTNTYVFSQYVDKYNIPHESVDSMSKAVKQLYIQQEKGTPYTTVIIGEEIPEQSRLVLAHTLKSDPEFSNVSLLLVSNFGMGQEWKKYQQAGYSTNLVLPIHQQNLLDSLRRAG